MSEATNEEENRLESARHRVKAEFDQRKRRTQDRVDHLQGVVQTLFYHLSVGWLAFWTVYAVLALVAGVGLLLIWSEMLQHPLDIILLLLLIAPAVGFVSLSAVTYLRVLVWMRDFGEWLWNRYTAPYEDEPYYEDVDRPEESLPNVMSTALRQGKWATFISIIMFFIALLYSSLTLTGSDPLSKLLPLDTLASILLTLFPPLSFTAAAVQNFLPDSEGTIVFFALMFGIPAIPFAFPVRNALYWAEHQIMFQMDELRLSIPPTMKQTVFIIWCLLVAVGAPASLYYFISEMNF